MNWLKTLWDYKKWWDSIVQTDWKRCFKLYHTLNWVDLTLANLWLYLSAQSRLSGKTLEINFPEWIILWDTLIKSFEIDFLNVSSDLYEAHTPFKHTKRKLLVADMPYIEWQTLQELTESFWYYDIFRDYWMENSIRKLLNKIWEYIEKKCEWYIYSNYDFHQLNPCNVKIVSIDKESSLAKLVVTDICMDIWKFISDVKLRAALITKFNVATI